MLKNIFLTLILNFAPYCILRGSFEFDVLPALVTTLRNTLKSTKEIPLIVPTEFNVKIYFV